MRLGLIMFLFGMSIIPLVMGSNVLSKEDKLASKNWCFFMICICGSAWNLGYLLMEIASNATDMNFGRSIALAGGIGTGCILTKFISILIEGNTEKKSNITIIVTFLGLVIFPLINSSDNIMIIRGTQNMYYYLKKNPITIIYSIYCGWIILTNLIITLKWIKVSKYKRDKFQGKAIAFCIFLSIIGVFWDLIKHIKGEVLVPTSGIIVFILITVIYYFSKKYNSLSVTVSNLADYIYSSVNTPILVFKENQKLALANSSAVNFFHINLDELIERNIEEIFTFDKKDIHMLEINSKTNISNKYNFDATCIYNNAKCNISATGIYDKYDEFICEIFVITDLTDKMELIEQLNESREEAVAANQAKSAFLANMSHEIRTPMNAIIGMSEIVLQKDVPKDIKDNVMSIRDSGMGLLTIINDILDLSKIESGRFEIINDKYMIPSVVTDIVNIIAIRLQNKPVRFIVNVDPSVPNNLIGDEIRIKQILINIIGNAVKFTQKGFIKMTIEYTKKDGDFYLIMKVKDSGIGIKKEDMEKLFGAFNQVDTRKNRNIKGTGLGLSISKNLSELMGGNIILDSEYGMGTTFTITLKQQVEDYTPIAEIKNKEEAHIIVYEESEILRESFVYTLERLKLKYSICINEADFIEEVSKENVTHVFAQKYLISKVKEVTEKYNVDAEIVMLLNINDTPDSGRGLKQVYLPLFCIQITDILNNEIRDLQYKQTGIDITQIVTMPFAKILIVDDNAVNLQVATGLMQPYKMQIYCAESGQEAIDKIKETKYDLVFMDHMMPGMDGVDATKIIRSLDGEYYKELPIVALTANALSEAKEMFLSNGFNDFLAKPIELSKLNLILKKWVLNRHNEIEQKEQYLKEEIDTQIESSIVETMKPKIKIDAEIMDMKIEGIDLAAGVNNVGGNMEIYMSILETYYKETKSKIKDLYETIENQDIQLFTTHVHGLKSSSASIGAKEVSNLAKDLESAGKETNVEYINNNINEFTDKTLKLLESIDTFMEKRKHKSADDLVEDIKEKENDISTYEKVIASINIETLEKLREAFNDVNMEEIENLLKKIKMQDYDENTTNLIKQIEKNLEIFEYDKAIELISEFLHIH